MNNQKLDKERRVARKRGEQDDFTIPKLGKVEDTEKQEQDKERLVIAGEIADNHQHHEQPGKQENVSKRLYNEFHQQSGE